jgi:hypothetical protein
MTRFWNWIKSHLFDGFLIAFVYEMIEEIIENVLAYFIADCIVEFAFKAFSTILITQGLKTTGKRLLFPYIKQLTYKEGNDKMALLKKYKDKVLGNKVTGTLSGLGFAGISYFQTLVPFATHSFWIALAVFVVFFNVGIFFGGETLAQIEKRLAEVALKKDEQKLINDAKKKYAKMIKDANQSEVDKAKAEAKAKANEERENKINELIKGFIEADKAKAEEKKAE